MTPVLKFNTHLNIYKLYFSAMQKVHIKKKLKESEKELKIYATEHRSSDRAVETKKKQLKNKRSVLLKQEVSREKKGMK